MKINFATILHLAEMYHEQYRKMNLCLSPEQNEASFRDFVPQYYSSKHFGKEISLELNPSVLLF